MQAIIITRYTYVYRITCVWHSWHTPFHIKLYNVNIYLPFVYNLYRLLLAQTLSTDPGIKNLPIK